MTDSPFRVEADRLDARIKALEALLNRASTAAGLLEVSDTASWRCWFDDRRLGLLSSTMQLL